MFELPPDDLYKMSVIFASGYMLDGYAIANIHFRPVEFLSANAVIVPSIFFSYYGLCGRLC